MTADVTHLLDAEVQDRRLRHAGVDVNLYIDTFDLRRALFGMWDYIGDPQSRPLTIKQHAFEAPTALVAALLDSGYLGPFHVLPPHQVELRRHVEHGEDFANARRVGRLPEDAFFDALGILRTQDGRRARPTALSALEPEEIERLVHRHLDDAPLLFKAVSCVRYTWWTRLVVWEQRQQLRLATPSFQALGLTQRPEFPDVLEAFGRSRSRDGSETTRWTELNDFADAVALMALLQMTDDHARGQLVVPRFYDSQGTFTAAAQRAGLADRLRITTDDGLDTPVLVGPDYLIFKASVRGGDAASAGEEASAVIDVEALHKRLGTGAPRATPDETRLIRRELGKVVETLRRAGFLRDVWLQTFARTELQQLVQRLREDTAASRSEEYQRAVNRTIRTTREALDRNTDEYVELTAFWITTELAIHKRRTELNKNASEIDPIRDFNLVRFGLTLKATTGVRLIARALLGHELSRDEMRQHSRWHELVAAYVEAYRRPDAHAGRAELAAAVLWCLSSPVTMDSSPLTLIIKLLRPYTVAPGPRSLAVMLASAYFARGEDTDEAKGIAILRDLERVHAQRKAELPADPPAAALASVARLLVAIAYLYFHLWRAQSRGWNWRDIDIGFAQLEAATRRTLEQAIEYADAACDILEAIDDRDLGLQQLTRYAQNQRLYYLLELGDRARGDEIERAYDRMSAGAQGTWAPTFDDTFARYLHFQAIWSDSAAEWERLVKRAIAHAEAAVRSAPHHAMHSAFLERLSVSLARGFDARLQVRPSEAPARATARRDSRAPR